MGKILPKNPQILKKFLKKNFLAKFTWQSKSDARYRRFSKNWGCDFLYSQRLYLEVDAFQKRIFLGFLRKKSFPKIHKFFCKLFQKFWTRSLRDRASLMHNIDDSAKTGGVHFFIARDCIWKLTHSCKRIFLVPKIPRFLTFFEKIFRLRSIIFKIKKMAFESIHELSIEYTFGARGAGQKNSHGWKVFFVKYFKRYGFWNLETKRESFGD